MRPDEHDHDSYSNRSVLCFTYVSTTVTSMRYVLLSTDHTIQKGRVTKKIVLPQYMALYVTLRYVLCVKINLCVRSLGYIVGAPSPVCPFGPKIT